MMVLPRLFGIILLIGIAGIQSIQSEEDIDFARDVVLNGAREMSEFLQRGYVLAKMITEKDVVSSDYEFTPQLLNSYEKMALEILDGLDLSLKSLNAAFLDLLKMRREELFGKDSSQIYAEPSSVDPEADATEAYLSFDPNTKKYTFTSASISNEIPETEIYAEPSSEFLETEITEADLSYEPENKTDSFASAYTSSKIDRTGLYSEPSSDKTVSESEVEKANLSYDPITEGYTSGSDQTSSKVSEIDESQSSMMGESDYQNYISPEIQETVSSDEVSNYNEDQLKSEESKEFLRLLKESLQLLERAIVKSLGYRKVKQMLQEAKKHKEIMANYKDYITEAYEDYSSSSDSTINEDLNLVLKKRSGRLVGAYGGPLSIPVSGIRGRDYPDYTDIPETLFTCADKEYVPGMYADLDTDCQVFHACFRGGMKSFLCPIGTTFNQRMLSCDYWLNSACSLSPRYYYKNEDLRGVFWGDEEMTDEYDLQDHKETLFLGQFLPVRVKYTPYTDDQNGYYPEHDRSPYSSRYPQSESRYPRSNPSGIETLAQKIYDGLFSESTRNPASYDRDLSTRRRQPRDTESVKEDRSGELLEELQNSVSDLPVLSNEIVTSAVIYLSNELPKEVPSVEETEESNDSEFVHLTTRIRQLDTESVKEDRSGDLKEKIQNFTELPVLSNEIVTSEIYLSNELPKEVPNAEETEPSKVKFVHGKFKSDIKDKNIAPMIISDILRATENVVTKGIMPLTKEILAASYSKRHKKQKL